MILALSPVALITKRPFFSAIDAVPVSSVRNATAPYTFLSEYSGIHAFTIFIF